ncbi:PREDICTED: phosphatidylserine decarboxylase [Prunus dulcis]|uniref:Phosphatidylserine decarboxylase proenzyme 1, mitochondrial n=1 Tax=Prunus dulcis TaxID=3755 RepID=A0A5E4FNH0_PRUDU|nr:phosphatidylserine decarboxylase proenzyme 1, mitochondrial isoform X1 [Prunus dulcis]XP_034217083.1 phosphatidylserine decarboxylase proenzyme 1, mitochondrial isoform X2 [Prunus dulcis]VVA29001.1 PREDICTED: phosphatidylserine decarboxylase [Prunus dulcis]
MKFRASHRVCIFSHSTHLNSLHNQRRCFASFLKKLHKTPQARSFSNGGGGGSKGDSFLLPGATVATLLMLGALHVRRMYDDRKVEEALEKGTEFEFQPDVKSTFLRLLPLRSISRCWGLLTSVEIPVSLRPYVYGAWARAFHSNLEEAALPLDEYTSLREFFVRTLKEGSRPIDPDPRCLVSPVDGTVLRFGELRGAGAMIEQVKGFSYSVFSLLGASSFLPLIAKGDVHEESSEPENASREKSKKSWLRVSLASPKVWDPVSTCPIKGLFYCVIYLKPGDYHRIHAPADWNVLVRRHFSGCLLPVNERATRTIRNLYVENERVVLEGLWKEGFMALAAVGATNIGSIELSIEPELRTNQARKKLLHSEPPEERIYEPDGIGRTLKKGDEVAAFNMGSTVVLVFQAPISLSQENGDSSSEFRFSVQRGDRVRVGEALGRWRDQ